MADVKLFLFGAPRLERNGMAVEVDTRDTLATLLWPEQNQSRARGALRRTLSTLNKALGGVGLAADRETVWLDSSVPLWSDIAQFQQLLAAARATSQLPERCGSIVEPLAAAVVRYSGDFMAGFSLRDSPAFDDWQGVEAERLRRDLATALERLVEYHTQLGAFAPAIEYARRWLTLDPLHEPAHRQLMLLLVWSGQRSAAIHQYRECVRVLDQELGVPPLEETTQLYQAIKENQAPAPPTIDELGPTTAVLKQDEGADRSSNTGAPALVRSPQRSLTSTSPSTSRRWRRALSCSRSRTPARPCTTSP